MTPHDLWLEPDEEDDIPDDGLTEQERRQKAFDDFDPPEPEFEGE